jgi:hypothetical protein
MAKPDKRAKNGKEDLTEACRMAGFALGVRLGFEKPPKGKPLPDAPTPDEILKLARKIVSTAGASGLQDPDMRRFMVRGGLVIAAANDPGRTMYMEKALGTAGIVPDLVALFHDDRVGNEARARIAHMARLRGLSIPKAEKSG